MRFKALVLVAIVFAPAVLQAQKPRERDLGLPIGGTPGPLDAITDVAGVEVGHTTIISGQREAGRRDRSGPHRRHRRATRAARPIRIPCSPRGSR